MDAQDFSFYIILSKLLFYQNKDRNVGQIRFHDCIMMHRRKRRVCNRKTLFGQSNIFYELLDLFYVIICKRK